MSIINTFDNKTKEILSPKNLVDEIENFPEVAILIFKERFFNYLQEEYGMKIIGHVFRLILSTFFHYIFIIDRQDTSNSIIKFFI